MRVSPSELRRSFQQTLPNPAGIEEGAAGQRSPPGHKPHGVEVEHGRLQLCQLDGSDAHGPDVAQLVVAAVLLHRRHLGGHPAKTTPALSSCSQGELHNSARIKPKRIELN